MAEGPRAAVFDLDGTLIDSAPSLCAAGNRVLAELGRPPVDVATYVGFVGRGQRVQVERLLAHTGGVPGGDATPFFDRFREVYDPISDTVPYPGAAAALHALAAEGWRLSVCTQKPEAKARAALVHFGFPEMATVVGGDTIPGALKPDPRLIAAAVAPFAGAPAVYVGDSETDAETARAGGLPFVLHLRGYRHGPAEAMAPRAVFTDFAALPGLLRRLT